MTNISRAIAGIAALALTSAVPLGSAQAADITVRASVKAIKSLVLTSKQDLDFGTVTMSGAAGTYTLSVSQAGVLSCASGMTCAGTPRPAIMNVQGSNAQVVRITVAPTNLVNALDGSSIAYTPDAPASVTLTNSGFPGEDFNIGGSLDIPSTADGTYTGNVQVTAEYQ